MGVNAVSSAVTDVLCHSAVTASCSGCPLRGDTFPEQSVKEREEEGQVP